MSKFMLILILFKTSCPQEKRGLVMSIFNWGIYAGIGISFPIGRYITEANFWDLVGLRNII